MNDYGRTNRKNTAPFVAFSGTVIWLVCIEAGTVDPVRAKVAVEIVLLAERIGISLA